MSWSHFFEEAGRTFFEQIAEHNERKRKKREAAKQLEEFEEKIRIKKEITWYLNNNIPVPEKIKKTYPRVFIDTCYEMGRTDLSMDVLREVEAKEKYTKRKERPTKILKAIFVEPFKLITRILDFLVLIMKYLLGIIGLYLLFKSC